MKNVLVVDDNKALLETLFEHLSSTLEGYNVLTAESGNSAIEILESGPVSLIMTDLAMPDGDGYGLLAYAKKKYPSVPIIIMSTTLPLDLSASAHKTDRVRFLEKPFSVEEMDLMVMKSLG